ncbi:uncharacterized protein LOC126905822 [Daktulosphaira vitifoliae]|uniref:uncharacterized protein LOC126905822 n=1 Tax=Daktulosphaira vitifoliae TaxID=58002 RepID=UPI0021AA73CD|nr:uncharacterized protein LOC126905822 [Daktulosphaira vitifoliae]
MKIKMLFFNQNFLSAFYFIIPLILQLICQVCSFSLEDALIKANAEGFPTELLYSVAGLEGRSDNVKEKLAAALENPEVQEAARKAAIEYALKDITNSRENMVGYCQYSWLRWLPFMNCDETVSSETRNNLQILSTKRNCVKKKM